MDKTIKFYLSLYYSIDCTIFRRIRLPKHPNSKAVK